MVNREFSGRCHQALILDDMLQFTQCYKPFPVITKVTEIGKLTHVVALRYSGVGLRRQSRLSSQQQIFGQELLNEVSQIAFNTTTPLIRKSLHQQICHLARGHRLG